MTNSTARTAVRKPSKPRKDFPLFQHATGRWCKKVRGQSRYFGKVADDPDGKAALETWLDQKDELLAGRTPRKAKVGLTIRDLLNHFLNAKRHLLETGEIGSRMFADYFSICELIGRVLGVNRLVDDVTGEDFDRLRRTMAKKWGPVRLGNSIQRIRSVFKFGFDEALIDKPVRFGQTFKRPSKAVLRKERAKRGLRMFEAEELRRIVAAAGVPLKAMILLGINCGLGNSDIAALPLEAVDLKGGWLNFPRPKTGIDRRCPLWPETIKALRAAKKARPNPKKEAAGLYFVTTFGNPWKSDRMIEDEEEGKKKTTRFINDDACGKEFAKLLKAEKLHRSGAGFYWLRHGFETVAGGSRDQVAVNSIMGHADQSMSAHYRERVEDERLLAVVNHVRTWLALPDVQDEAPATVPMTSAG